MTQELTDERALPLALIVAVRAVEVQRDSARAVAVGLEQELAETQRRCNQLIRDWTTSGSMLHAAQLAEALELGAGS
jgi:hypothetical protein